MYITIKRLRRVINEVLNEAAWDAPKKKPVKRPFIGAAGGAKKMASTESGKPIYAPSAEMRRLADESMEKNKGSRQLGNKKKMLWKDLAQQGMRMAKEHVNQYTDKSWTAEDFDEASNWYADKFSQRTSYAYTWLDVAFRRKYNVAMDVRFRDERQASR